MSKNNTSNRHPEFRKPEPVPALATPKFDIGGLVASRMRDGFTLADRVTPVNKKSVCVNKSQKRPGLLFLHFGEALAKEQVHRTL